MKTAVLSVVTAMTLTSIANAADFDPAITAPIKAYEAAVNTGDIEGIKDVFTSDAVLMAQNAKPVEGEGVITSYEGLFNALKLDIDFNFEEATDLGNGWAIVRTQSGGEITFPDAETVPNANQELFILQNVGGIWKIARYAYATTAPMH